MLLPILILLFPVLSILQKGSSQPPPRNIVIVDSISRQPLPYVSVLPGGGRGFVGDGQGKVWVDINAQAIYTFSSIGYRTRHIIGAELLPLDTLTLAPAVQTLGDAKVYSTSYFNATKTIGRIQKGDFSFACDSSFDGRGFAVVIDLRREVPPGTEVVWIRKLSIPLRKDRVDDRQVHPMKVLLTESLSDDSNAVLNREEIFIDQDSRFERNGTVTLDISAQRIMVAPKVIYIQLHFLHESPPRNYTSPQIYISGKPVDNFFSLHRNLPTRAGRIETWSVFSREALVPYERFEQGAHSVWNVPLGVELAVPDMNRSTYLEIHLKSTCQESIN